MTRATEATELVTLKLVRAEGSPVSPALQPLLLHSQPWLCGAGSRKVGSRVRGRSVGAAGKGGRRCESPEAGRRSQRPALRPVPPGAEH